MTWTPPIIPARQPGWDRAGGEVLQRMVSTPLVYGETDCLKVVAEICRVMTGVDPMAGLPAYASAEGALELLDQLGFGDIEAALKAVFPEVPTAQAWRFDCGVVERRVGNRPVLAAVILTGHIGLGRDPRGPVTVGIRELRSTFAIGAR